MIAFGAICATMGGLIYGLDCGVQKLLTGQVRPPDVLLTDLRWAAGVAFVGVGTGLAAPLYVG